MRSTMVRQAVGEISASMAPLLAFLVCLCAVWPGDLAQKAGNGYRLVSIGEGPNGSLLGSLEVIKSTDTYGPDIPHLQLYVKHETEDRLRVHITDAKNKRWEVPQELLPREQAPYALKASPNAKVDDKPNFEYAEFSSSELIFSCTSNPFGFAVKRKSNGDVLFNSTALPQSGYGNLVFKDQYLEISTSLPTTASLYGLGENTQPQGIRIVPNEPYTLFTTDISAINLNTDLYGVHPFYLDVRNGGVAHGVLLLNSNGMDIFYTGSHLTYKVIGGVLDFYFFAGPSPLSVVQQYTSLIGRPAAMPYWAFGFHQCRWGYRNVSDVESVVAGYSKAKIPLDVLWNDDDHMDGAKDFTLDPVNYPAEKLRPFVDRLHANGQRYVVLIDPGIGINSSYGTFQRGMAADVFIKHDGHPFVGQVWPGAVYFPDFLNPKTVAFWSDEISRFHEIVPVDGLWIDMNEVSNFCTGKCTIPKNRKCPGTGNPWDCCLDCTNITDTKWDVTPYRINASGVRAPLGQKTIATSAVHYNGVREYDAHSLYGLSQAIATHGALVAVRKKRPFVLTRSTFVGSGSYAAHWTGDNKATWEDLRYSISTILNFGMFGIPMVGADICGFYPDTTEELCNRWIQLGAFYPFSRDHANNYSSRQELYLWDSVAKSARNALGLRYRLLPYLYTLNYEAHVIGAPIARPLFFSFADDAETYGISTQFLLGEGVLVSPVLKNASTSVEAYFPRGSWYNLFDMTKALKSAHGQHVTLDAPLDTVNVHVHEGVILPMQRGGLTSTEARLTPFTLVVAFPLGYEASGGQAKGKLFLDSGEDLEMRIEDGKSTYVEFYAESDGKTVRVRSDVEKGGYALGVGWVVEKLVVLGLSSNAKKFVNANPHSSYFSLSLTSSWSYSYSYVRGHGSGENNVLLDISGLALPIGRNFDLTWALVSGP